MLFLRLKITFVSCFNFFLQERSQFEYSSFLGLFCLCSLYDSSPKINRPTLCFSSQAFKVVKNNQFLSQMFCNFQDGMRTFLVLRYEKNGSLLDVMNRMGTLTIECAQSIVTEVVLGLQVLHVNNIIHADLKPENILLDANLRAHVADFGLSISVNPQYQLFGKWGTDAYQSPEQLDGKTFWDHRVDYFSLGVIFLTMTTGQHPFGQ